MAFFVDSAGENKHVVPPSPPAEQNESGCICRGAVFVEGPALTPIDQMHWCPLLQDVLQVADTLQRETPGAFASPADRTCCVPLAGRALRTWQASFLF